MSAVTTGPWPENNSATEADYQGNPHLKPELAWGIDAGWERHWAEGAMVSASAGLCRFIAAENRPTLSWW